MRASSALLGVAFTGLVTWRFGHLVRRYGGWGWVKASGAGWFLALGTVGAAAGLYLSSKPDGFSRESLVLLSLASMAAFGGSIAGFMWRLHSTQPQRFRAACARLREQGFLSADSVLPLEACSEAELDRCEARLYEAHHILQSISDWERRRLGDVPDLIERDLAHVDATRVRQRRLSRATVPRQSLRG